MIPRQCPVFVEIGLGCMLLIISTSGLQHRDTFAPAVPSNTQTLNADSRSNRHSSSDQAFCALQLAFDVLQDEVFLPNQNLSTFATYCHQRSRSEDFTDWRVRLGSRTTFGLYAWPEALTLSLSRPGLCKSMFQPIEY